MHDMTINNPVVVIRDGKATTNSRDVAAFFGKRHDHILRDVDKLLKDIAPQNWGAMFSEVEEFDANANRTVRSFNMTRDGFTLLAMGFTGQKALQFKVRYIQTFNAMESAFVEGMPVPIDMKAVGGMVKGIIGRQLAVALTDILPSMIRAELAAVDKHVVTEYQPASSVLDQFDLKPNERRGLARPISYQLTHYIDIHAERLPARRAQDPQDRSRKRYMFHVDVINEWMIKGGGMAYVLNLIDRRRQKLGVGQVSLFPIQGGKKSNPPLHPPA